MGQKRPWSAAASARWAAARRVGMDAGQGKVPEHEPELAAELLLQPLDGAEGHAAVGAFVVAVLDQGDRGPLPAAPMVAVRVDRRRQVLQDRAHHIISSPAPRLQATAAGRVCVLDGAGPVAAGPPGDGRPLSGSNQYRAEVSTARSMARPRRALVLG